MEKGAILFLGSVFFCVKGRWTDESGSRELVTDCYEWTDFGDHNLDVKVVKY